MLLNVFCFLFLFRLFSFSAEMCNRNTNCHCAFTRSQSALKACIRLGIEILWFFWCINAALITLSTRELIVYLIWNLLLLHWTFYRIIIGSIQWHMQIFLGFSLVYFLCKSWIPTHSPTPLPLFPPEKVIHSFSTTCPLKIEILTGTPPPPFF